MCYFWKKSPQPPSFPLATGCWNPTLLLPHTVTTFFMLFSNVDMFNYCRNRIKSGNSKYSVLSILLRICAYFHFKLGIVCWWGRKSIFCPQVQGHLATPLFSIKALMCLIKLTKMRENSFYEVGRIMEERTFVHRFWSNIVYKLRVKKRKTGKQA